MPVIAYFGPAGTFTEMATTRLVESGAGPLSALTDPVELLALPSPPIVIEAVRSGDADFGCVPVESSIEGSVPATMDALVPATDADRVQIFAEVVLDIAFTVGAARGLDPDEVRTVAAYPVAQAQVRDSVARLFPKATFVLASSNSAAAADVKRGEADAAITTPNAAATNRLHILARNIADSDQAATRFVLLGRPAAVPARTGTDRTSVIVDLVNRPGSLLAVLDEFAARGIDLTRIESRPRRNPTSATPGVEYRFFIDAVGHIDDAAVGEALRALHRDTERVVFLGSWHVDGPSGTPPPDHRDSENWFARLREAEDGENS